MRKLGLRLGSIALAVVILAAAYGSGTTAAAQTTAAKPNFVFILADSVRVRPAAAQKMVRSLSSGFRVRYGEQTVIRRGVVSAGTVALLLLLAAGCSAGNDSPSEAPRDLRVERISSSAPGQGPGQPRVIVAPSAAALSEATGAKVPDSGEGTYLAAYWGEKPTGGYSLAVDSARLEGDRVMVRLVLKEPPRDAIVTQALTYPYAVAVVRELDPRGKQFSVTDKSGRELGWPVRFTDG